MGTSKNANVGRKKSSHSYSKSSYSKVSFSSHSHSSGYSSKSSGSSSSYKKHSSSPNLQAHPNNTYVQVQFKGDDHKYIYNVSGDSKKKLDKGKYGKEGKSYDVVGKFSKDSKGRTYDYVKYK